jgi:transmembrane sensor
MKPSSPISAAAEEQASLWAARLEGSVLTAADRLELDRWLAVDPVHRTLLSSYCQFSADLEQQLPLLAGIRDELAEVTAAQTARPLPWLRWPILAGAMLTAAAVVVAFLWLDRPQNHFQNLATPVAQRQEVTLADGTQVELNARTALVVDFRPDARRVRLADGEAYFRVSKDAARPFFVETPAGTIRVTGTEFNVRTESLASLEVTVREGTVQVRPGGSASVQSLQAGDRLVSEQQQVSVTSLSAGQLNDALAWRQGRIVFDGTPLREALGRFARYHGRNLTASDTAAMQRVGGGYSLDDLDGFLAELEGFLSVRVTRASDGSIHVTSPNGL